MHRHRGDRQQLDTNAITIVDVCLHVINICMESGVSSLDTMSDYCCIVSAETTNGNSGKDRRRPAFGILGSKMTYNT